MQGRLFSQDFLLRGIQDTEAWKALSDADLDDFTARLRERYAGFSAGSALNEAQTEDELIEPVLDLLGWRDCWTSQVNLSQSGREDVPDFLLFADAAAKQRAMAEPADDRRARHGVALLEAKRWLRPLDRSDDSGAGNNRKRRDFGAPSSQMLRYLACRRHQRPRGQVGHPHQRGHLAAVLARRPLARRGFFRNRLGRVVGCARQPVGV
ncbi:hypothetical protein [Tepidimonas taiwanensis]|uniref:hypothetical protein n=1 Tax=Tepidimonas taiwanensis TaxID=307486 RepID=UPI0012E010DF|nr:hypothetical protein [Tepidimonas taiwanensis]